MKSISFKLACITIISIIIGCNNKSRLIVEQIGVENFIKDPLKSNFQLSPNGKYYSYTSLYENISNVFVLGIENKDSICLTKSIPGGVDEYKWIEENKILLKITAEDYTNKLCTVDKEGRNIEYLINDNDTYIKSIKTLKHKDKLIVNMRSTSKKEYKPNLLNINSKKTINISGDINNVDNWVFDHNGKCRIAVVKKGLTDKVLYRTTEQENFETLIEYDHVRDFFKPVYFTSNNKNLIAYSNINRDKIALVEYDLTKNKEDKILYQDSVYDILSDDEADFVKYSEKRNKLDYIFHTTERRTYKFFDNHFEKTINNLKKKFSNHILKIISSNNEENKHIILVSSDKIRGIYYYYDETSGRITQLENSYPWLKENDMAEKKSIKYKTKDGFTIHGYLTLPQNKDPKNLPVVVFPHGGPAYRDCWEMGRFHEVQMYANRGYAVLQINFRGSFGFGKRFLEAGFKQNGLNVQNDITEGVEYLIKQNIADKDKVAIIGGSYGGYAVLAGLAFTPDLYACGVDLFGVSDFSTFLNNLPPWFNKESLYKTIGHPLEDFSLLEKTSPINKIDSIRAPLLVAHGGKDPVINKEESDQIVNALKKRDIEVEYIYEENEGHGYFEDKEARLRLWKSIDLFLAKYLS